MELCVDTSTRYASVGVSDDGHMLAELSWRSARNHSVELVPALRRVMEHANVRMEDATAIFVAQGPGGFSALRVGLSVCKALAMARDVPLVAVNTLDIEAYSFLGLDRPVSVAVGAGRSKVYLGTYDTANYSAGEYQVVERERLADVLAEGTLLCGEEAGVLRGLVGPGVTVVEVPPPTRRPSVLVRLGHERLNQGPPDDLDTLQPIYMQSAQFKKAEQVRKQRMI